MKKPIVMTLIALASAGLVGCTDEPNPPTNFGNPTFPVTPAPVAVGTGSGTVATPSPTATPNPVGQISASTQVERLARPGINEALVLSNGLLNTMNVVGPDVERSFFDAAAAGTAASHPAFPIVREAGTVLEALGNGSLNTASSRTNTLLGAFLPDVMRIDTTAASGYGAALNTRGSPVRGRMITDDVIDITLSVLVPDATASAVPGLRSDNVAYQGTHQAVMSSFPYLATPN